MYCNLAHSISCLAMHPGAKRHSTWRSRSRAVASAAQWFALALITSTFGSTDASTQHNKYIDITLTVQAGMPVWESSKGLQKNWRTLFQSIAEGDVVNQSWLNLDAHTGTHIDAPAHFLCGGSTIEQLDLDGLIGPALVVDVPPGSNITADVLQKLQLPSHVQRLLFKTENTAKGLLFKKEFTSDYIGLDSTAASYLSSSTNVVLVGVDYLSVGMLEDIQDTHKILFHKGIVVVEGLDLRAAEAGWHNQICLPSKLGGSDGAPVRCILQPLAAAATRMGQHDGSEL